MPDACMHVLRLRWFLLACTCLCCGLILISVVGVPAATCAVFQVLASVDGAPMMQVPGPNTLITPQGQTLKLPADWKDKEIKESMQSHFD